MARKVKLEKALLDWMASKVTEENQVCLVFQAFTDKRENEVNQEY